MGIDLNVTLVIAIAIFLNVLDRCEMSIYPGLRRKPLVQSVQQPLDVSPDFLSQLMEENARRKLQQQFEHQLEIIKYQIRRQREQQLLDRYNQHQHKLNALIENDDEDYRDNSQGFRGNNGQLLERPVFAVGPSDPRYYINIEGANDNANDELSAKELEEYEEYVPIEKTKANDDKQATTMSKENAAVLAPAPVETSKLKDGSISANFHRIKPQSSVSNMNGGAAGDAISENGTPLSNFVSQGNAHDNIVMREHIGFKNDLGVYIIALIAGVSAAFTVGLIALGIVWVHKRTKATGDVDYPAYGVTGPLKDASPSGDRKLAQSAQMYHYQHQKQQIIAMENQQIGENCCALSDVDSDDDNEEGDYTVYECPGLAPTGEMEVKNPLFLDETPGTPLKNVASTHITLQQPQANKKEARLVSHSVTNPKKQKKNKK